ncbi:MAG TPA: ABC transporter [Bacteroidetes bacterium]|jgi:ABC-2 type transport system ATP-binding protein|nr:ABC transporter [Bacteroidota bacterium]
MIELRNLTKKFGSFAAVNDISLTVPSGQFFGFLGPNGAGKTTTIKMMTGLYAPTAGQCFINGFDIQKQPYHAKLQFGYVPDQPYLYERLSGREFLYFVGGLFNMSSDDVRKKVEALLDMFEIGAFVDKRAEEYSQGMRQRIVLTAALLHDPKVLIIDEPIVGLDPRSARLVKDTLKAKTLEGLTVFMSTHLLEIVEELCDRIAIIKDGRIIHEELQNEQKRFNGQLEAMFLELTK